MPPCSTVVGRKTTGTSVPRCIAPGATFRYVSGCPLTTSSGIMAGSYRMVDETGRGFDVTIPAFSLDSPTTRKTVN